MPRPRTSIALLLLGLLGLTTGCADMLLRQAGDELRRQQVKSEPMATGVDSGKNAPSPTRALVHGVTYDAADGLVDGVTDSLQDPERQDKLDALADKLEERVESISEGAGEAAIVGVNAKLPEMQGTITRMVRNLRRDLDLDPEKTVQKVFKQVGKSLESEVRPQVKQLVKEILDEAMGPGLQTRMDENVTPSIKGLTDHLPVLVGDIAEEAISRSLDAVEKKTKNTREDIKDTAEEFSRGLLYLLVVLLVLLAIVLTIVFFLWWRARAQRERREQMLRLVTGTIKTVGKEGDMASFRAEMKRGGQKDRKILASLNKFLTEEGHKL